MITHYDSQSKGRVLIAEMNPVWLANTAKILRNRGNDPDTLAIMDARLAELAAMPDDAARIAATSPKPAPIGDNKPPADPKPTLSPAERFPSIKVHIDDLYDEAKNWLDGTPIATQAQADEVSRLKGMLTEAHNLADKTRIEENEPFDTGKAAVQEKYAPLISDTKKVKGKTILALDACSAALTAWLIKVEADRVAAAEEARKLAEAKKETAATAAQQTDHTDLGAMEFVDELVTEAKVADKQASAIENDRAAAGGGEFRRTTLRDNFVPHLTNATEALRHYMKDRPDELRAFLVQQARLDVRVGKRSIPGFEVKNEPYAI